MATYSGYTFNNMSRIGVDECSGTQDDLQNVAFCNYMTQNYFASDCNMKVQEITDEDQRETWIKRGQTANKISLELRKETFKNNV